MSGDDVRDGPRRRVDAAGAVRTGRADRPIGLSPYSACSLAAAVTARRSGRRSSGHVRRPHRQRDGAVAASLRDHGSGVARAERRRSRATSGASTTPSRSAISRDSTPSGRRLCIVALVHAQRVEGGKRDPDRGDEGERELGLEDAVEDVELADEVGRARASPGRHRDDRGRAPRAPAPAWPARPSRGCPRCRSARRAPR